jgi:hypothetical protein
LTLSSYPYFYSYWNPLLGGGAAAVETLPVGSGEGLDKAIDVLNQLPDAERLTLICGTSIGWCEGKFAGVTWPYDVLDSGKWMQADYALLYIAWLQRQMYPREVIEYLARASLVYEVRLSGAGYAWLYRVPEVSHISGDKLEGRGTLFGYNLSSSRLQAGGVLTATLYWRNEGQRPDDALFVSVEDAADYAWATALAQPRPEFEEASRTRKAIVESEAVLSLPPGMPPGQYYLKTGFVTGRDRTLVGRFSMPPSGDDLWVVLPATYPDAGQIAVPHPLDFETEDISLLGYDLAPGTVRAGERAWLTLFWQARRDSPRDYALGISLLDSSGREATYWLGRPVYSGYATSQWIGGQLVQDPWELALPSEVAPGAYRLELAVFDGLTGETLARLPLGDLSVVGP